MALQLIQAWALLWQGQVSAARKLLQTVLQAARANDFGEQTVTALSACAFADALSDQARAAYEHAQQAVQMAQSLQNATVELLSQMALTRTQLKQHNWAEAITTLEALIARFQGHGFGLGELARLQLDLSLAYLASGDARRARELANQALQQAQQFNSPIAQVEASLAQVCAGLYSSKPQPYLKRYRSSLSELEQAIDARGVLLLKPDLLLLQARWAELRDESEQAQSLRQQAQAVMDQLGIQHPSMLHLPLG